MWNCSEVQLRCVQGEKVTQKKIFGLFYLLIPFKKRNLVTYYKYEFQDALWNNFLLVLQTGHVNKCDF